MDTFVASGGGPARAAHTGLPASKRPHLVVAVGLALLTLGIMLPTFRWSLKNDDYYHIARAERVRATGGPLAPFVHNQGDDQVREYDWSRFADPSEYFRPMVDVSFEIDHALYGLWQPGYRLSNGLIYVACALTVYWLGLLLTGAPAVGALAAVLFLLNPGHFAAIGGQVAGRTDSLVACLALVGVATFIRWRQTGGAAMGVMAASAVAAAVFTKETGVLTPVVCLVYDVLFTRPVARRIAVFHLVTFGACAVYLLARYAMFSAVGPATLVVPTSASTVFRLAGLVPRSLGAGYVGLLPHVPMAGERILDVALTATAVGAYLALAWRRDRLRVALLCLAAFYAMAAPVALSFRTPTMRWFVAASAFAAILFADLVLALARRRLLPVKLGLAVAVGLATPVLARGLMTYGRLWTEGDDQASVVVRRVTDDLEKQLQGMPSGTRLFVLAVPSLCHRSDVFLNGLQDWVRLRYGIRVEPHVVSTVIYPDCAWRPNLHVEQVAAGRYRLAIDPDTGMTRFLLSQTHLERLAVGDSITCRFCTVVLRRVRRNRVTGVVAPVEIEIGLRPDDLNGGPASLVVAHDGRNLQVLRRDAPAAAAQP